MFIGIGSSQNGVSALKQDGSGSFIGTMSVIVKRTIRGEAWCVVVLSLITMVILEVTALNGPNVCMVKQK